MTLSFRGHIAHPTLQGLYDYWLARRGAGGAMLRRDFDPIAIPFALRHLILADVADGGRAIRYRVVGTEVVDAHGMDYTGRTVEQITSGATLDFTRSLYGVVVNQVVPVYSEGRFRWEGKEFNWTKRLHLPMSRDGAAVDLVLAGQVFEAGPKDSTDLVRPARPEELAADRAALPADR
ncbi:MAG: PAS domain-containing protein [Alphaproteobacteria bacterium]|nr:PAS domain-containing protein [Alphaproteobacteria bacterium]